MQLPIFIAGLLLSVVLAAVAGFLAGFETVQLVLFVIAVAFILQLAFVLIVALMAAAHKRKAREADDKATPAPSPRVPHETDA